MEAQTRDPIQDVGKDGVGPVDQGPGGPEVGGEQQGFQGKARLRAGQALGGGRKKPRFGLAPAVNGLLGIPHHRQAAAFPGLPARHEAAQQVHLVLAGILEFVHQQVLQLEVQTQQDLAGVFVGEQPQGGLLQGDEVQGLTLGAESFVSAQRLSQENHQILQGLGFLRLDAERLQLPAAFQLLHQRVGQFLDHEGPGAFIETGRESQLLAQLLAALSVLGQ